MSLADDLAKLDELRRNGALNDAEFEKAKATLLEGSPLPTEDAAAGLAELRKQNELARIDREWEKEQQQYLLRNRYGYRQMPTTALGAAMAIVGGGFGLLWTFLAMSLMSSVPAGPLTVPRVIFPLFGVLFTLFSIGYGVYAYRRAQLYQERYRAYRARRQRVQSDDV